MKVEFRELGQDEKPDYRLGDQVWFGSKFSQRWEQTLHHGDKTIAEMRAEAHGVTKDVILGLRYRRPIAV